MQEEKLVELLDELMSTACDNCKKNRGSIPGESGRDLCGMPCRRPPLRTPKRKQSVFKNRTLQRMRILP